jgi:hypothetical protein
MAWRVHAAAVIGKSHIDEGLPCQDAFAHAQHGDTLFAVVCDGAGSQPNSHHGAEFVSTFLVAAMEEAAAAGETLAERSPEEFQSRIGELVGRVRAALSARAEGEGAELSSYACTLVGAVADARGGWLFHIGDGLACADALADEGGNTRSLPENGEYANETYFATGEDWAGHLRCTRLAQPVRTLALMSDGAMPFVMAKGNDGFYAPFMQPVLRFLAGSSVDDGSAALAGTLGDERTWRITGDDKTLLLALWT